MLFSSNGPWLWCRVIGREAAGTQKTGGSLKKRTPPIAHPSWSPGESQLPRALIRRHSRRSHKRPADRSNDLGVRLAHRLLSFGRVVHERDPTASTTLSNTTAKEKPDPAVRTGRIQPKTKKSGTRNDDLRCPPPFTRVLLCDYHLLSTDSLLDRKRAPPTTTVAQSCSFSLPLIVRSN